MAESELGDKPVLIAVLEESATRSSALASSLRLLNMLVESARSVVKGTESQRRFNVQFAEFCRSTLLAREAWEHAITNSSYIAKRIADNREGVNSKPVETSKSANRLELLQEHTSQPTNSSTVAASISSNDCTTLRNNYNKWQKEIIYYKKHGVSESAMLKEIASYVASQTPHLGRRYVEHIALGVLQKSKRTETTTHSTTSNNTHLEYNKKKSVLQSPQPTLHSSSSSLLQEHVITHATRHDASRKDDKQSEHYLGRRREREREPSISGNYTKIELDNTSNTSLCGTHSEHAKKKNAFDKCAGNVCDSDTPTDASISHFLSSDDRVEPSMQEYADHTSSFDLDHLGELDEEVTHRAALGVVMEEAKKTAMANTHSNGMLSSSPSSSFLESKSTPSQTKATYSNTPVNLTRPTVHQNRRAGASDDTSIAKEEGKVEEGVFVSHYRREAKSSETRGNKKMELSHTSHALRSPHQLYDLRDPAQKLSVIPELSYRVQPWAAPVPSLAGVALDRVVLDKMERRSKMPLSTSPPSRFSVGSGSGTHSHHCRLPQASEPVNKNVNRSEGTEFTNNINITNTSLAHNKEEQQQQQENKQEETQQQKEQSESSVQQKEEHMKSMNELQQHHERKIVDDIDVLTLYDIISIEQPTELLHAWEHREGARAKFWNNALQSATHAQLVNNEARKESSDNKVMHINDTKSSAQLEHNASELPEQVDTSVETKNVNYKNKVVGGALPADAFFLSRSVKENASMPWSLMINHIHYGLSHLELPYAKR